jgi:hypothetical protein
MTGNALTSQGLMAWMRAVKCNNKAHSVNAFSCSAHAQTINNNGR